MIRDLLPAAILAAGMLAVPAIAGDMPDGFVYLSDIEPGIAQDMRYAGPDNFTQARVPGYLAAECLLTVEAASALANVQAELAAKGDGLLVYDCYRPARAVRRFAEWASRDGPDILPKPR